MLPTDLRTIEAAARISVTLGRIITPVTLANVIRNGRMTPPAKDSGGRYSWSEQDLAAAVAALNTDRRRKEFRTPKNRDAGGAE